uniref:Uncharacterized protein n=1 Tax=Anguilla anguilla TaxID=7936 RepID=A0A0E9RG29_ANGAN
MSPGQSARPHRRDPARDAGPGGGFPEGPGEPVRNQRLQHWLV